MTEAETNAKNKRDLAPVQMPHESIRIHPPKEGIALIAMKPRKPDGRVPVGLTVVKRWPTADEWPMAGAMLEKLTEGEMEQ